MVYGLHYFFKSDGRTIMSDGTVGNGLQLMSPAFKDGRPIPEQYSCRGQNINPQLNIVGTPDGTKTYAMIMHDPDAVNGDFVHWVIMDIPGSTESIPTNKVPVGAVQGLNGAGSNKYIGPCPPDGTGTHHYLFELFALDTSLNLPANSTADKLRDSLKGHVLDEITLTGLFSAKN
jgi:Raf kinase inhibitor-like YbhB/YbcL family protein